MSSQKSVLNDPSYSVITLSLPQLLLVHHIYNQCKNADNYQSLYRNQFHLFVLEHSLVFLQLTYLILMLNFNLFNHSY